MHGKKTTTHGRQQDAHLYIHKIHEHTNEQKHTFPLAVKMFCRCIFLPDVNCVFLQSFFLCQRHVYSRAHSVKISDTNVQNCHRRTHGRTIRFLCVFARSQFGMFHTEVKWCLSQDQSSINKQIYHEKHIKYQAQSEGNVCFVEPY